MARAHNNLSSNPIDLSTDDDNLVPTPSNPVNVYDIIDDDDDDREVNLTGEDDELEVARELTPGEAREFELAQNNKLPHGHKSLRSARGPYDILVKPNMGVQLKPDALRHIHFLWIKYITQDETGVVFLKGLLLKRNAFIHYGTSQIGDLHAILPLPKNDLCMQLRSIPNKLGSPLNDECLSPPIPLSNVEREREIIFTNYEFPAFSYRDRGMSTEIDGRIKVEEYGVLCCRWKYVEEIGKVGKKKESKTVGYQLSRLAKSECDKGKGHPSVEMRRGYGDPRKMPPPTPQLPRMMPKSTLQSRLDDLDIYPKQSRSKKRDREEVEEIDAQDYGIAYKRRSQSVVEKNVTSSFGSRLHTCSRGSRGKKGYTYGDLCAGGGGTLRAGEMAGLMPKWAVDHCDVATSTIRANWPGIRIEHVSIQDFVLKIRYDKSYAVDVIHISYPCPGHSRRNKGTNPERDAENNALIMTLKEILLQLRPRIVTLEQTDHIQTTNEGFFLRKMISEITAAGYSARWRVFNMAGYGVPSARKRLIVAACCPGQPLFDWPQPTHGQGPGLIPPVTIGQAIQDIPENATLHNVAEKKNKFRTQPLKLDLADMNRPLQNIIMTKGARFKFRDPDGDYEPTWRQLLRLMTFPDHHILTGSTKKDFAKQIGNAVPCYFMKQVFEQVIKALEKSDKEAEEWDKEVLVLD